MWAFFSFLISFSSDFWTECVVRCFLALGSSIFVDVVDVASSLCAWVWVLSMLAFWAFHSFRVLRYTVALLFASCGTFLLLCCYVWYWIVLLWFLLGCRWGFGFGSSCILLLRGFSGFWRHVGEYWCGRCSRLGGGRSGCGSLRLLVYRVVRMLSIKEAVTW